MADVIFAVFALGALYYSLKESNRKDMQSESTAIICSLLVALATLTRFEGFLLVPGFLLYYLLKRDFKSLFSFLILFIVLVTPWFILTRVIFVANTATAYIKEASGFIFDRERFRFFALSYVFSFGFAPAFLFFISGLKRFIHNNFKKIEPFIPLFSFLILETALSLYWTPSVPRILLPIIPLMTIFFVEALNHIKDEFRVKLSYFIGSVLLIGLYLYGQFIERTHFLVLSKTGLLLSAGFASLAIFFILFKKNSLYRKALYVFMFMGLLVANFVILGNHREHYWPTKKASSLALEKTKSINGRSSFSDETGVSRWILERDGSGFKLPIKAVQFGDIHYFLNIWHIDYIVWSNEFERGSSFWWIVDDVGEMDHFKLIEKFEVDVTDKLDLLTDRYLNTNLVDKRWIQEARVYEYLPDPDWSVN